MVQGLKYLNIQKKPMNLLQITIRSLSMRIAERVYERANAKESNVQKIHIAKSD